MGRPGERPMRGGQIVQGQIRSGLDESFRIERDAPLDPLCTRNRPCHEKNVSYVVGLNVTSLSIAPAHPFEMVAPFERHLVGVSSEDDRWIACEATNQIAPHGFGKAR